LNTLTTFPAAPSVCFFF